MSVRGTVWIYVDIFFAWLSMLLGLYLVDRLVDLAPILEEFMSRTQVGVVEVLITALLFLLWLIAWRILTVKAFRRIIGS